MRLGVLNWRHNRSQSSIFGVTVLYPTRSEIWRFWHIKTWGRKIAIEKFFLLHLSAHWGDLIEQIKKKSVIYTLKANDFGPFMTHKVHVSCNCYKIFSLKKYPYLTHCMEDQIFFNQKFTVRTLKLWVHMWHLVVYFGGDCRM